MDVPDSGLVYRAILKTGRRQGRFYDFLQEGKLGLALDSEALSVVYKTK